MTLSHKYNKLTPETDSDENVDLLTYSCGEFCVDFFSLFMSKIPALIVYCWSRELGCLPQRLAEV